MPKLMHKLYDNLNEAKAFAISFTNFAYFMMTWKMQKYIWWSASTATRRLSTQITGCPDPALKRTQQFSTRWSSA